MEVFCKDIGYSFEAHPQYGEVRDLAVQSVKEMYEENQRFEREEAKQMLEDGEISDLSEYDGDYSEPFDEKRYSGKITEITNKYMCNLTDVPQNAVIEFDADKVKDIEEAELKKAVSEKYGIKVNHIANYDKAANREIMSQQTYDSVGKMFEREDYQSFINLKSNMENYSFKNIAMIYGQKPESIAVNGFSTWNKEYNRSIVKGEHALKIWCPAFKIMKTEKDVDKYIENNAWKFNTQDKKDKEKERLMDEIEKKGSVKEITGFTQGNVFDVSQTLSRDPENDVIEKFLHISKPLDKDLGNFDEVTKAFESASGSDKVKVSTDNEISEQERLWNAVNKYADKVLSEKPESVAGIKSATALKGDSHRLETLAAASLICKHIGVECEDKSSYEMTKLFKNLSVKEQVTVGKRAMFEQAFERGNCLAQQFDKAFDKELGYDIEAQKKAIRAADKKPPKDGAKTKKKDDYER